MQGGASSGLFLQSGHLLSRHAAKDPNKAVPSEGNPLLWWTHRAGIPCVCVGVVLGVGVAKTLLEAFINLHTQRKGLPTWWFGDSSVDIIRKKGIGESDQ